MADALKRIGIARRDDEMPTLVGYRELQEDGRYVLALHFDSSKVDPGRWQDREAKLKTFFGKDVAARLELPGADRVELYLKSQS
jgi:hypothetical protein